MIRNLVTTIALTLLIQVSSNAYAFSDGETYSCRFDKILRFYENRDPYLTDSYSNQSPITFKIHKTKGYLLTGENWFLNSALQIKNISDTYLIAFNGLDMINLRRKDGIVKGYAGTLDSYIKMFYVRCRTM